MKPLGAIPLRYAAGESAQRRVKEPQ